jgi:hypothetical protein
MLISSRGGYTRGTKLALLAIVAAAVWAGVGLWPPVKVYFHVREDARRLANRLITSVQAAEDEQLLEAMLAGIHERDRLMLTRADISLERTEASVTVRARLRLPYRFPFLNQDRIWQTTVETQAVKARGF